MAIWTISELIDEKGKIGKSRKNIEILQKRTYLNSFINLSQFVGIDADIDMTKLVLDLRKQRAGMIQTPVSYEWHRER